MKRYVFLFIYLIVTEMGIGLLVFCGDLFLDDGRGDAEALVGAGKDEWTRR